MSRAGGMMPFRTFRMYRLRSSSNTASISASASMECLSRIAVRMTLAREAHACSTFVFMRASRFPRRLDGGVQVRPQFLRHPPAYGPKYQVGIRAHATYSMPTCLQRGQFFPRVQRGQHVDHEFVFSWCCFLRHVPPFPSTHSTRSIYTRSRKEKHPLCLLAVDKTPNAHTLRPISRR